MNYNQKEAMLQKREKANKLNCALADFISLLSAITCNPVRASCDRVYCYCNIGTKDALFGAFCTLDEKAYQLSELIDRNDFQELNITVISLLTNIRSQYQELSPNDMPVELFLDFNSVTLEAHALACYDEIAKETYDATLRYSAWLREHGGTPKPLPPRNVTLGNVIKFKMGKMPQEEAHNPTANAVELDMQALRDSQMYAAGEIADPIFRLAPETGWDAVRAEFNRAYPGDAEPMSFESDDGESWVDIYDGGDCWNYVSCGLSAMGAAPAAESLGGEYTVRLKKHSEQEQDDMNIFRMLGYLRAAMAKAKADGALIADYGCIALEDGGFIAVPEAKLKTAEGPSGSIGFTRLVYVDAEQLKCLEDGSSDVRSMYIKLGRDLSKF